MKATTDAFSLFSLHQTPLFSSFERKTNASGSSGGGVGVTMNARYHSLAASEADSAVSLVSVMRGEELWRWRSAYHF